MNDNSLRQNILDELEFEPSVNAAHIAVTVENGVATLGGHVRTYAEKEAAERVVSRVKGVRGIAQEIDVRLFGATNTDDDAIAQRALKMIDWNVSIPKDAFKVRVAKGWITISGKAEWQYQKDAAQRAVQNLEGVVGVSNMIEIAPRVSAVDVRKRIKDAFERNAELEAQSIKVDVSGSKVILKGHVKTWSERRAAERAVWSAPGVSTLEDQIAIR
ncbi:BON domain-containing protein [Rhizobium sp. BK376]|uniref:BON domain-containing protein n=1 Tax=Rhizobium sp. BK376 TaxID=2512149 RepID=UPI0010443DBE|nr:BON domain-containing protein [Rhizobium sp. BK376]TCR75613.1 osmotically-inducible protein OsmY [Rhizobium sp. BK376]